MLNNGQIRINKNGKYFKKTPFKSQNKFSCHLNIGPNNDQLYHQIEQFWEIEGYISNKFLTNEEIFGEEYFHQNTKCHGMGDS